MNAVLIAFWVSFAVAAVLAAPILSLLIRLKSRQTVSQFVPEHQKKQGTPTMGGLIAVVGTLAGLGASGHVPHLLAFAFLFVSFAAIGFVDDFVVPRVFPNKRGLGWKQKILLQILLAGAAALIDRVTDPLHLTAVVFAILFFSNAYNFADGLDALAGSIGVFLLSALALIGYLGTDSVVVPIGCVAIVGSLIPFLFLNAPPAKVFMGDVGSLPIGAALGFMMDQLAWHARAYVPAPQMLAALAVLSLMMVAELIPVPLQIGSVKLFKKKLFLKTPIHHGFETRGWPETRIVWRFALVQLLCSAVALSIVLSHLSGIVIR